MIFPNQLFRTAFVVVRATKYGGSVHKVSRNLFPRNWIWFIQSYIVARIEEKKKENTGEFRKQEKKRKREKNQTKKMNNKVHWHNIRIEISAG